MWCREDERQGEGSLLEQCSRRSLLTQQEKPEGPKRGWEVLILDRMRALPSREDAPVRFYQWGSRGELEWKATWTLDHLGGELDNEERRAVEGKGVADASGAKIN